MLGDQSFSSVLPAVTMTTEITTLNYITSEVPHVYDDNTPYISMLDDSLSFTEVY